MKLIFSFILPVTVLVLVPLYIEKNILVINVSSFLTGIMLIFIGLCVITVTIISFMKIGKGTLAPWNPTQYLVTSGMYRYVRNPMIIGVLTVLIGESICITSLKILLWALVFFIINNIFFVTYEEPNLEKKFGDQYRYYKRNVPRWIPRLKPFKPEREL